ncbi:aldo/keto reductase [candidate division KSB1 bacterium]
MSNGISRRNFMRSGLCGAAYAPFSNTLLPMQRRQEKPGIKEFRVLGRTGMKVSDVSLGAGVPQDPALVNYVIDLGVNYVDTAERYARGQSEVTIGEIAKKRRKDFYITTKLAVSENDTEQRLIDRFHGCLERLQTDYVDVLMFHNPADTETLTHPAFHSAFQKLKADSKVRFTGLSSHEPSMVDICNFAVDDGRFDVLLLVYNFMQEKAAGLLRHAREKNIGTTIMKVHASEHPEQLMRIPASERQKLQEEADRQTLLFRNRYNLSENEYFGAALRWVLQNNDVGTACMSIRNFTQADDYISCSGNPFTGEDTDTLGFYSRVLDSSYCRHACGECELSCPNGVAINDVLRIDSYFTNYRQEKIAMVRYSELKDDRKALPCGDCEGHCDARCRYNLAVRNRLIEAHKRLTLQA